MLGIWDGWFSYAIITSFLWGLVPTFEKIGMKEADQYAGMFLRCCGVCIGVLLFALIRPSTVKDAFQLDSKTVLALLIAGVIGSVLGQFTNLSAMKLGDVSQVTPITSSWPLIATVLALVLFNETLTLVKVAGLFLILGGVVLLRLKT